MRARHGRSGQGPAQSGVPKPRVRALREPSVLARPGQGPAEAPLPSYLSGLFSGPAAAQLQEPMSVQGGRPSPAPGSGGPADPGEGARAALLAPSHAPPQPQPAPDRGRTASASARPCAPTLAHTLAHSHSRALSHTHPFPPLSVYLLQLSGDPGGAQHRACATQSPPTPPRASLAAAGHATEAAPGPFPERRARVSSSLPSRARQRPLPAPPTDPRRREGLIPPPANRLRGWLPSWPIGERESPSGAAGPLGICSFFSSRTPAEWGSPPPTPVAISYPDAPPTHHHSPHVHWKNASRSFCDHCPRYALFLCP